MKRLIEKLRQSPINYFSDLFIIGAVIFWIVFCLVGMVIAVIISVTSVVISICTAQSQFDISLWETLATVVTLPITTGVGVWLIKCAGQHWLSAKQGREAEYDFPDDGEGETE